MAEYKDVNEFLHCKNVYDMISKLIVFGQALQDTFDRHKDRQPKPTVPRIPYLSSRSPLRTIFYESRIDKRMYLPPRHIPYIQEECDE